jgi:hypothetical protein
MAKSAVQADFFRDRKKGMVIRVIRRLRQVLGWSFQPI